MAASCRSLMDEGCFSGVNSVCPCALARRAASYGEVVKGSDSGFTNGRVPGEHEHWQRRGHDSVSRLAYMPGCKVQSSVGIAVPERAFSGAA